MNLDPQAKKILCYGDSNTWGFNPENGERFDINTRWTGVLQKLLGQNYWIIENGLNGRTTEENDIKKPWRHGAEFLVPFMQSQNPIDICILFLGTNDLKDEFDKEAKDVAKSIGNLIDIIRENASSEVQIIVVCPTVIDFSISGTNFSFQKAESKSLELPKFYEHITKEKNCILLDLQKYIKPSEKDGLHLDEEAHRIIAEKLLEIIKRM